MTISGIKPIGLDHIKIMDSFWRPYIDLISNVAIPYQWAILNNEISGDEPSYCLQNYSIAAGEQKGRHQGIIFIDSDVTKWLEAVAYSLQCNPNEQLEKNADKVIELIGRAQQKDGYLNTYFTIEEPGRRWSNLTEAHELYCAGHLIEAAVAYYTATGKDVLLKVAMRFSDLICNVFGSGEGQNKGYPGHQEIELALIRLYSVTGQKRYLEQAKYFIDVRGHVPNYFLEEKKREPYIHDHLKNYDPIYSQSHMPPREQTTAEGHAVRALYMYSAMAELAYEYADEELLLTCDRLWENIVKKRMYLTGGIGASAIWERFTTDYDLPNDVNYAETCASVALAMFGSRMSRIQKDASYYDAIETALYNTILAGISLSGDHYFYVNPLEVWPKSCMGNTAKAHVKPVRQKWFDCACCPTNVARTLTALGNYVASVSEEAFYLNLFVSHQNDLVIRETEVEIKLESSLLTDGSSTLYIVPKKPVEFEINIRIPHYVKRFSIYVDGVEIDSLRIERGYVKLCRQWQANSKVDIRFDIRAEFVAAHPAVRADTGKIAIVRGPFVYCLEEADNGDNLSSIFVSQSAELREYFDPNLFGGVTIVKCKGEKISDEGWDNELYKNIKIKTEPVDLTAIPYYLWGNRGENEMLVWLKAKM